LGWKSQLRAFFIQPYNGHTPKERALAHRIYKLEILGMPIITAFWLVFATAVSYFTAGTPPAGAAPPAVRHASAASAILAAFTLYQHMYVATTPLETNAEIFGVMQKVGRWVFLTRQVLSIQAIHACLTWAEVTEVLPSARILTHSTAMIVGGLGLFVWIQFFTLVWPDQGFKDTCNGWKKKKVPFTFVTAWLHIPCGPLALLDVLVLKSRGALLAVSPPLPVLVGFLSLYALLFLAGVHANHYLTGCYPYPMMARLGHSLNRKWLAFAAVQAGVVNAFLLVMWLAARWGPAMW